MPMNFVETLKNYFSPGVNDQLAKSLNESAASIDKALAALIPVGLGNISTIATSGKEGANHIFDVANSVAGYLPASMDVESLRKGNETHNFLSDIFESNQYEVIDSIMKYAGIQEPSASYLLEMIIPPAMGLLGKHATQNDLSAIGLSGFLSSQYNNIVAAIPAELSSLNNMADFDSIRHGKRKAKSTEKTTVTKTINEMVAAGTYKEGRSRGMKWLLASALIIVVILIIWYFTKR